MREKWWKKIKWSENRVKNKLTPLTWLDNKVDKEPYVVFIDKKEGLIGVKGKDGNSVAFDETWAAQKPPRGLHQFVKLETQKNIDNYIKNYKKLEGKKGALNINDAFYRNFFKTIWKELKKRGIKIENLKAPSNLNQLIEKNSSNKAAYVNRPREILNEALSPKEVLLIDEALNEDSPSEKASEVIEELSLPEVIQKLSEISKQSIDIGGWISSNDEELAVKLLTLHGEKITETGLATEKQLARYIQRIQGSVKRGEGNCTHIYAINRIIAKNVSNVSGKTISHDNLTEDTIKKYLVAKKDKTVELSTRATQLKKQSKPFQTAIKKDEKTENIVGTNVNKKDTKF